MTELEEKWLKLEERQMEEAQQRCEEREFQLRMMQMMSQSVYGVPPPNIHVNPRSFTFRTMHENTLARRMHMFPSQVDSDNET